MIEEEQERKKYDIVKLGGVDNKEIGQLLKEKAVEALGKAEDIKKMARNQRKMLFRHKVMKQGYSTILAIVKTS
jgi:hypothetical protein